MKNIDLITTFRTPNPDCPACGMRRLHTVTERAAYHPFAGHGFNDINWSHPAIDPATPANQALTRAQNALSIGPAVAYTPRAQATKRGNP